VEALLRFAIYVVPFVILAIGVRLWMKRRVGLSEVQAEGDPRRSRSRFLLGIWRREDREQ
jgi:uncharacterized membrane protein YczE